MAAKEMSATKRIVYVLIGIAILVIAYFIPTPEGLTAGGKMALALLISGIFLWITEPLPMAVSALGLMVLMPGLGVFESYQPAVWQGFISSVIFFVIASFGITTALLKTKIPARVVFAMMKLTKGSYRGTILAFMVSTAVLSAFMSNLPCTAMFAGIAMSSVVELERGPDKTGATNLGRALMIGISYASTMGGMITPAGSSLNIMTLNMLNSVTEGTVSITFLNWVLICGPIAIILLIICWLSVTTIFKSGRLSEETLKNIEKKGTEVGKFEALDKKVLGILLLMIVCWIASNWTGWDATAIAVGGLVLFFIPGIDVLKWDEFVKGVSWSIVLLMGSVQSIAGGIQSQGAASWILSSTVGKLGLSGIAAVAGASIFLPLLRLLVPVGPAMVAITLPPLVATAGVFGVSAVTFAVLVAFNSTTTFLLGVDNNSMMSYKYGQWTFGEFFKAGIVPQICMIALLAFLTPGLVSLVGY
jgi:sodium-dependent dicarboxylate transporter 2/3/5